MKRSCLASVRREPTRGDGRTRPRETCGPPGGVRLVGPLASAASRSSMERVMAQRLTGAAAIAVLTAACGPGTGSGNVGPGTQQVTVQVSGHGAVQLSTGQQCKDKCVVPVANGTRVTATASPDGGGRVSGWSGRCGGGGGRPGHPARG